MSDARAGNSLGLLCLVEADSHSIPSLGDVLQHALQRLAFSNALEKAGFGGFVFAELCGDLCGSGHA